MVHKEHAPPPNEPSEPTSSTPPPDEIGMEPAASAHDQAVPVPRRFSEEEKHKREEIIHDFFVRRRLGRLGLTLAERRAGKAMRGPGPRNVINKQGWSKSLGKPAESLREEN